MFEAGKRGRPRADTIPLSIRLPRAYVVALDKAVAREGSRHSRPQAVRLILREWLNTRGLLGEDELSERFSDQHSSAGAGSARRSCP
ncbi:ribbon-helix-helix protein, CopG family [Methylobacterium nigriterrae]|uniref:ribbon-helix-helix protein, CopG family n=1 Tax=Methylobacterium nigriterrae TaxID=3127512 RepID=UPI0030136614